MLPKKQSEISMDKLHSELQLHTENSGIAFTITGEKSLKSRRLHLSFFI